VPPEKFENYFHHESEIWYPDGMKAGDKFVGEFLVCLIFEGKNVLSDGKWLFWA
jgi:hypothetical protein